LFLAFSLLLLRTKLNHPLKLIFIWAIGLFFYLVFLGNRVFFLLILLPLLLFISGIYLLIVYFIGFSRFLPGITNNWAFLFLFNNIRRYLIWYFLSNLNLTSFYSRIIILYFFFVFFFLLFLGTLIISRKNTIRNIRPIPLSFTIFYSKFFRTQKKEDPLLLKKSHSFFDKKYQIHDSNCSYVIWVKGKILEEDHNKWDRFFLIFFYFSSFKLYLKRKQQGFYSKVYIRDLELETDNLLNYIFNTRFTIFDFSKNYPFFERQFKILENSSFEIKIINIIIPPHRLLNYRVYLFHKELKFKAITKTPTIFFNLDLSEVEPFKTPKFLRTIYRPSEEIFNLGPLGCFITMENKIELTPFFFPSILKRLKIFLENNPSIITNIQINRIKEFLFFFNSLLRKVDFSSINLNIRKREHGFFIQRIKVFLNIKKKPQIKISRFLISNSSLKRHKLVFYQKK